MRLPRLYAPGLPQLVQCSFSTSLVSAWNHELPLDTFDAICAWVNESTRLEGVRLHAWSLTPQALRMVATPSEQRSLSRLVQAVGRKLGANRQGPVFAGRFRSCLLEPSFWVIPAILWVELAPVLEHRTSTALGWRWSSANEHCGTARSLVSFMSFHHDYWVCGNTPFDRQLKHKTALSEGLLPEQSRRIEQCLLGQWALGSEEFVHQIQSIATRRATPSPRGRPRKSTSIE